MEKVCFKCGVLKPLDEYYKHKEMGDGHLNKCKLCVKANVNARYYNPESREKIAEYERARFKTKHRKEKIAEYRKHYRAVNRLKYIARNAVNNALRDGAIVKLPCEMCGSEWSQAHHEDYSKPLDVKWLCFNCHRLAHDQIVNMPDFVLPTQNLIPTI